MSRWKEYFEGLMNDEDESERRTNGGQIVDLLTRLFNTIPESERMPDAWRRGLLVPIFKTKDDVQSCSSYRSTRLIRHIMKVWERVVDVSLRQEVLMSVQQFGFVPRKSTTDAIFGLRALVEKYGDSQKELHCVLVGLEKACDA